MRRENDRPLSARPEEHDEGPEQVGSNSLAISERMIFRASKGLLADLNGLCAVSDSKVSAMAHIRAYRGISPPVFPKGYPFPLHRSWWYRMISSASSLR